MNEGRIILIDVDLIENHPDNPRKNLGDLTELRDSIKQSGILQNLTVIPHPDKPGKYRALIGHRRLSAAQLAGYEMIPCVVLKDLTHAEQVGIMMAENVQRQNLTLAEEVHGIQLMLDLGESVDSISEKTGMGKSTVYKRKKLTKYSYDDLSTAVARGATLADYEKLDEIEDEKLKNRVLKTIGTNNFAAELARAKDDEKIRKNKEYIESKLSEWATKLDSLAGRTDLEYVTYVSCNSIDEEKLKKPEGDGEYFFNDTSYNFYEIRKVKAVDVRRVDEQKELLRKREEEEQKRKARREELDNLDRRMFELRRDYITSITPAQAAQNMADIAKFALTSIFFTIADFNDDFLQLCGIVLSEEDADKVDIPTVDEENRTFCLKLIDEICKSPADIFRALLLIAYTQYNDSEKTYMYNTYTEKFFGDEHLNVLYNLMENNLQYQMSDEEKKYLDGTHELFAKKEQEDDN